MLDPKKQAEIDQCMAGIAETLPPMIRQLYVGLLKEGFSEPDAMAITKMYVFGLAGGKTA